MDKDGFDPLPEGKYTVLIDNVEVQDANPNVRFTVTGDKYANRKLFFRFRFANNSEKGTAFMWKKLAELLGTQGYADLQQFPEYGQMGFKDFSALGALTTPNEVARAIASCKKPLEVVVEHDTYENKAGNTVTTDKIAWFNPVKSTPPQGSTPYVTEMGRGDAPALPNEHIITKNDADVPF
jgi:hypothetical protein